MIGGLDKPNEGHVFINDVDIAQLDAYELAWLRCRKIGYIFQTFNLIPVMTALENVTLPMIFAGMQPDEARRQGHGAAGPGRAGRALPPQADRAVRRPAAARGHRPLPGQRPGDHPGRRTHRQPRPQDRQEIIDLLRKMNKEKGVTIITATHDLKMLDVSDRIFHIRDGQLAKVETRDELDPRSRLHARRRSVAGRLGSWSALRCSPPPPRLATSVLECGDSSPL